MTKAYRKLKPADFAESPIWEWAVDEESHSTDEQLDDSRIRPTAYKRGPRLEFAQCIVSASIELKCGQAFPGIAEVTIAKGLVAARVSEVFLIDRQFRIPGAEANRLLTRHTKSVET